VTFRFIAIAATIGALTGAVLLSGQPAAAAGRQTPARAPAAAESFPVATAVRLGGDDKQTRFVLDLTRKIDLATFTLADPYRVVVDLPQVTFKLPVRAGEHGRGLVTAYRFGLVMKGGSRIVLDTKGPVRIEKAFTLGATESQPARLVLDLAATDRPSFLRNISLNRPVRPAPPKPGVATPLADSDPRPLIVLDPGHGGIDNGTRAKSGVTEKEVVLAFSLALRDRLAKSGKYRVEMTRADDTFVPLGGRVQFARTRKAALFISIHADFLPRSEGQADGASIYTLSEHASDAEAGRLADAENKADVIAGVDLTAEPDDVANILVDLAQRETKTFSVQFARTAMGELKTATPMHKRPIKAAGFKVLTAPDVPSVLIELGYMSDKGDLKHLTSPVWRERTTAALAQAIDTYFAPRLAGAGAGAR
jgi:N-acetylmuramoyl-L-alanine amidase